MRSQADSEGGPNRPYGHRLSEAMARHGRLCVGIDPHPELLSDWTLDQDASGLREFGLRVVEAAAGRAGVVKPQVAFFERLGASGMKALTEVQRAARQAGLLVIADAKRGDIGSTMAGYAAAWLDPEAELAADALTVSPFLGFGSLRPAVEAALRYGAGLHVLALTSNPEGSEVQLARGEDGQTVAARIIAEAARAGGEGQYPGSSTPVRLGSIGLVIGATTAELAAKEGIDLTKGALPILAPGYGAQGAGPQHMRTGFGPAYEHQVLVSASRSILRHGPEPRLLAAAIERAQEELT